MKKYTTLIMAAGLLFTLIVSNTAVFLRDGKRLDELRGSVLRLHILANSDSDRDQSLKLLVRDALLEHCDELFGEADSLEEAENIAAEHLPEIERIACKTLLANGSSQSVSARIVDMHFDERIYGNITMPAGDYRALRIELGEAEGHNWWCVMYPPLCLPAACEVRGNEASAEKYFGKSERDIMYHPKKYRVRFAVWDKLKKLVR